jgi:SAM-dependent methyltransferase
MIDQTLLDRASQTMLDNGIRLLQGARLADTDAGHITKLLEYMRPEQGSRWLDIGSGFGEPARLMREQRPDLQFTLVNNNAFQRLKTPSGLVVIDGDMHELPFDDRQFDGAMFLYSLCHADNFQQALDEAARVVRPGGALFVFDYLRMDGDDRWTEKLLASRFMGFDELDWRIGKAGWQKPRYGYPDCDDTLFRQVVDDAVVYRMLFADLVPIVWRAVRDA